MFVSCHKHLVFLSGQDKANRPITNKMRNYKKVINILIENIWWLGFSYKTFQYDFCPIRLKYLFDSVLIGCFFLVQVQTCTQPGLNDSFGKCIYKVCFCFWLVYYVIGCNLKLLYIYVMIHNNRFKPKICYLWRANRYKWSIVIILCLLSSVTISSFNLFIRNHQTKHDILLLGWSSTNFIT